MALIGRVAAGDPIKLSEPAALYAGENFAAVSFRYVWRQPADHYPNRGASLRLIAIMRGALSGGRLVAWGSRSLTAWYEGVGIRGLQTATNTDLKAVLAEKIPEQQVMFGTDRGSGCAQSHRDTTPSLMHHVHGTLICSIRKCMSARRPTAIAHRCRSTSSPDDAPPLPADSS